MPDSPAGILALIDQYHRQIMSMHERAEERSEARLAVLSSAMIKMSDSVSSLAESTARYEERTAGNAGRMKKIEARMDSQGVEIGAMKKDITINDIARKGLFKVAGVLFSAMAAGSITAVFYLMR